MPYMYIASMHRINTLRALTSIELDTTCERFRIRTTKATLQNSSALPHFRVVYNLCTRANSDAAAYILTVDMCSANPSVAIMMASHVPRSLSARHGF